MLRETLVDANGLTLNVATGGAAGGTPLLLLHGVMRCWQDFSNLLPSLTAQYQVTALDFRGHGRSSRSAHYRVIDYADDVVAVLRTLNVPAVIYGHSLGAMAAAAAAGRVPELVRAVVLEDPPFHTMGERIRSTSYHALFSAVQALIKEGGSSDIFAARLADIQLPTPDGKTVRLGTVRDAAALRFMAEALTRLDPEVLTPLVQSRWLDGYDSSAIFKAVNCPALLLQGDEKAGGALIDADAAIAAAQIRRCTHLKFDGCSHQIHASRPAEVLTALQQFVTQIR